MTGSRVPDGFLSGVATSGHQNEGGNSGSDTWFLEHVEPTVFREPSGRACGSWERWAEDLDLVVAMGLDAYRFSVEWARVEPEPGTFDDDALAHYEAVVDGWHPEGGAHAYAGASARSARPWPPEPDPGRALALRRRLAMPKVSSSALHR